MNNYITGVMLTLLSAFGFGVMPLFALYAYQDGINVPTLLFLRFLLASASLFAYVALKKICWMVSLRQLGCMFLLGGVLYAVQSSFYFSAVKYIPASLAALILYLYPVLVALLAMVVDKEALSSRVVVPALVALAGLAIVLGAPMDKLDFSGVALAFGAALIYSVYIIIGRRVVSQVPPVVTTAFIAAFAAASFFVYGWSEAALTFSLSLRAWLLIGGVVFISTVLAMATFFAGMQIIGPTRASILSTVEPVITFGFSALLLGEKLTALQCVGAALVLLGAVYAIRRQGADTV